MLAVMLLLMRGMGVLFRGGGPSLSCGGSSLPGAEVAHAAHAGGSVPARKASWACCLEAGVSLACRRSQSFGRGCGACRARLGVGQGKSERPG